MIFKKYDIKKMVKDIKNAIKKYEQLHGIKSDKIKQTKITLPKIIYNNEEIDLEEKYKNAKTVMTQVGILLGVLYMQKKEGSDKPLIFFHTFEKPRVLLTTDNGKSIFIAEDGDVMVDETGIIA